MMQKHLQQISDATSTGRYALVIMDRASWHSNKLKVHFDNLLIIHLPPYSPELNPIEQIWAWLSSNDLSNRVFKDYDDIVEQVSEG
jgi:transposase